MDEQVLLERIRQLTEQVFDFVLDSLVDPHSALKVAPLDLQSAKAVGRVARASVPDMPDRIIAAMALQPGIPLVTRDWEIAASGIPVIW